MQAFLRTLFLFLSFFSSTRFHPPTPPFWQGLSPEGWGWWSQAASLYLIKNCQPCLFRSIGWGLLILNGVAERKMCSILCFICSLEAWSSALAWAPPASPTKMSPSSISGTVRWKPQGLLGMPSLLNWGGDPNKIDATKAGLAVWESQAVSRKRRLSCWNVDIINKTNASHFNTYLNLAASFRGQPHLFCSLFYYLPLCFN